MLMNGTNEESSEWSEQDKQLARQELIEEL